MTLNDFKVKFITGILTDFYEIDAEISNSADYMAGVIDSIFSVVTAQEDKEGSKKILNEGSVEQ